MILKRVKDNLEDCENPKAIPGARALQGTRAGWRYRVGSYRILASVLKRRLVVEVIRVGHKQGMYRKLPNGT